jgi:hypothetical protein
LIRAPVLNLEEDHYNYDIEAVGKPKFARDEDEAELSRSRFSLKKHSQKEGVVYLKKNGNRSRFNEIQSPNHQSTAQFHAEGLENVSQTSGSRRLTLNQL